MRKKVTWLIIFMFIFLAACQEEEAADDEQKERIVAVKTVKVKEDDFIIERSIHGRAAPSEVTPVMLPASGEVSELAVSNGDDVEDGDRIAVLSTPQGNMNINAPGTGQVTSLHASEGALVSNEEPFAMIMDTEEMLLQFTVTANELERFVLDETYAVLADDSELEATVTLIDSMPGETGLYPVEAKLENPDNEVLPGMVLEMTIPETLLETALIVPTEAVVQEDNQTFVYVVEESIAYLREVTIEQTGTEFTAVKGEVEAGDVVVIEGQLMLADGDQVDAGEGE